MGTASVFRAVFVLCISRASSADPTTSAEKAPRKRSRHADGSLRYRSVRNTHPAPFLVA